MSRITRKQKSTVREKVGQIWRTIGSLWSRTWAGLRNRLRLWRRLELDFMIMPIGGSLPERAPARRGFFARRLPFPKPPLSLEQLNLRIQAILEAKNVRGVVFVFEGFQCGIATIQNFRRSVQRLRAGGKEVVVYTPYLDLAHYYAASAAGTIVVPPETSFDVIGLRAEVSFLKDTLQQVGVEMDVVQISPYKTAFDALQHSDLTAEHQAQLEWLLDDQYEMLSADLADGRRLEVKTIKALIDEAPYSSEDALAKGLVDHVAYEDELTLILKASELGETDGEENEQEASETVAKGNDAQPQDAPTLKLKTWSEGFSILLENPRRSTSRHVGVVSLQGLIMMGSSRRLPIQLPIPFIGGEMAGEQTLVALLRKVEKSKRMAALILHVDSGGGSAQASDLIGRQIQRIAQKKPVVVYMGDVAASGGYYVSAHAQHIMSQTGTITGSIGVIVGRPSTMGLYEKLQINRVSLKRGRRADLFSDQKPMTEDERMVFTRTINSSYRRFKENVSEGRDLPFEQLDAICEGRVWTGRQALELGLVDSHGDFEDAVTLAAQLGDLHVDQEERVRVVNYAPRQDDHVIPSSFVSADAWQQFFSSASLKQLTGQAMWLMPYQISVQP